MKTGQILLKKIQAPGKDCTGIPIELTDQTISERKEKVLQAMKERELSQLVVYGDVEHGGNFEYLVGYFTRFEEGLFIIKADETMTLVLGNENLNKAGNARVNSQAVHVSLFSLPNQPNREDKTLKELLAEAGLESGKATGLAGWKMFTSAIEECKEMSELPCFIIDAVREIVGEKELLVNATDLFLGENGVRTVNNANEIAHYEYGASLASDGILDAMNAVEIGVSEQELGGYLNREGQHNSIVTIASSGPRFLKGNMFPTSNTVHRGDPISLTVGYRGGASSRTGYAVKCARELPAEIQDYTERVVFPYFRAYVYWLEIIRIGMTGGELFAQIDQILPRKKYGWTLCPGHLTAEEEWLSSPVYEKSQERLKSGMIFQIDMLPSVPGYGGTNAESTVVLANEKLQEEVATAYPELWKRMKARRAYLQETLGIRLSPDVLPMCSTVGYLRPFLLDKETACVQRYKE